MIRFYGVAVKEAAKACVLVLVSDDKSVM